MKKRTLGQTGIEVSVIGLGTVKWGRNQGVKYPLPFDLPSDDEITRLLGVAAELGVNLLDTAPAYGLSEERMGKLLRGQRHEWVICTKAGESFENGESNFDFSAAAITNSVERSLKRLQTDYLDCVLIHSNGDDRTIIERDEVFVTLETLKRAGKLRAYGMSTKTVEGGLLAVEKADVVMVTYHPESTDDETVITQAQSLHKGVLIKKALASGHAAHSLAENFRFILSHPGVTSIIVGTLNPAHLMENVQSCETALNRLNG